MALSCQLSMDLLCQEMRDAFRRSSDSLDSTPWVQSAREVLWWNCHSSKAFLLPWTARDRKEGNVLREMKEEGT